MDKSKHPYLYFGIFTVIIQPVMWGLFSLYDYGIDEGHWGAVYGEPLLLLIAPVPIVSYIILNKRYFTSADPIKNTAFQMFFWFLATFFISAPVHLSISYDQWIVKQNPANPFNGVEYVIVTIFEMICGGLLLIKLIAEIVVHIRKKVD